jgi:hypothetical protein
MGLSLRLSLILIEINIWEVKKKEKSWLHALISTLFTSQMNDQWQDHAAEEGSYPDSFGRLNSPVPPFFWEI